MMILLKNTRYILLVGEFVHISTTLQNSKLVLLQQLYRLEQKEVDLWAFYEWQHFENKHNI